MKIELEPEDLEDVAADLCRWRPEKVIELIKVVDQYMSDWSLVLGLKDWVDVEVREYARETAAERREAGECYIDPETTETVHQTPHKGCVLS